MINRLPVWFRQEIPGEKTLKRMRELTGLGLNTVCQEAKCPNLSYCFKNSELTFMILGDTCTRSCRFCAVHPRTNWELTNRILPIGAGVKKTVKSDIDSSEPYRVAGMVKQLNLKFVVITSVTRDDLDDGGAGIFAKTVEWIRGLNRKINIELLIPDFKGSIASLKRVVAASPDVIGHNIETVKRLYKDIRPQADYEVSLGVLRSMKEIDSRVTTKSSIMLGLGEKEAEVIRAMRGLRESGCDILTLGQYLAPSKDHYPVKEFISPAQFIKYQGMAMGMGFKGVLSGPKVRSSYKAEKLYREVVHA